MKNEIKLPKGWLNLLESEFSKGYMSDIKTFLYSEYSNNKIIYPSKSLIFNAFNLCDFDEVKVIILGQDPYHGPDQAHGLSFSVRKNIPFPPSLKNIIKELENDIGVKFNQNDGNLSKWAKQGVFLLNTTLTVEKSKPLSHSKIGWELFTDKVIELLSEKKQNLVFILWGKHAQAKDQLIDNSKHLVISSTHPSPLSAHRGFFGSKPFSQTNNFLLSKNIKEINW
ncbi:MAG: uracil-DNA glycosylase [Chloroflexota bacterium]|nr:uracil-DNA glycosylase [Chloroflexota bacterium]MED5237045.1 uracil-DNA glycosylase [Chloroflexota bacterium]